MLKNEEVKELSFRELKVGDKLYFVDPTDLMEEHVGYVQEIIESKNTVDRPGGVHAHVFKFKITKNPTQTPTDKVYYIDVILSSKADSPNFEYHCIKHYSRHDRAEGQYFSNTILVAHPDKIAFYYDWLNALLKNLSDIHLDYIPYEQEDNFDLNELNNLYGLLGKLSNLIKFIKQLRWNK